MIFNKFFLTEILNHYQTRLLNLLHQYHANMRIKENEMNSQEIKKLAKEKGADLVGIAPIELFKDLPKEENPLSIAPECKSVIVIARRILRGSIRGVEEGTNFNTTYMFFGYETMENAFLSRTTYDVVCQIEEEGFEAVPLFAYNKEGMAKGKPVSLDKPAPNVIIDVNYAAQAAGLGEMGLGGFFLTPQYGSRQRFSVILTDAELEYDSIQTHDMCSNCDACAKACPFGAINTEDTVKCGVKEYERTIATIDYDLCRKCPNGAMLAPGRGNKPDRIAAICGRQCIVELEGKLDNKFKNNFRQRKTWALDTFDRPIETKI